MKKFKIVPLFLLGSFLFSQDFQTEVQPIFDSNCTPACHNPNNLTGGLNLTDGQSYNNLVNVSSQGYMGFQRVVPFDTTNSVLYQKIIGNTAFGTQMPKNATPLPQTERDKIGNWIMNGALETSGGTSFSFDYGFGGHIETSSPIDGQQNWSIEFWLNFHQQPTVGVQDIFNRNRSDNTGPDIFFQYDGTIEKFRFFIENGDQDEKSKSEAFDNQFHHYYFEGDGSKVRWYFDGHLEEELTMTASFPTSTNKMIFGKGLDGSMDEVRFRTLSGFSAVPTAPYGPENGTVLLWRFDTQSPTVVEDASGFNNQGTIVGTSAYTQDVYSGAGMFFAWLNGTVVELEWVEWNQTGGGTFDHYEIHRSQTPGVTTASPLLVSISEIDTVHFIDTNPPQGDVYYKLFVMDASSNILADYGEVYVNTTAGIGGIDVTIASSATTSGLLMVGLMNPGVDANYWNNRDRDWALGSFNFPGNYQFNLADNSPDGNDYHLMAFVDLDGDSILNDASEAFGISNSFNIAGGYGNAGQVNLDFGGSSNGFNVTVDLQEDYPFGQLYVALYKEGDNPDVVSPLHQEQVGVDPPFNQNIFIPQALPEDKQYFLAGFFDVNGNMMPDTDEPVGQSGLFSYPPTGEIFLHLERMIGPEIDTTGVSFLSAEEGTNIDISTEVFSTNGVDRVELHYWSGNTGVVRVLNMNRATGDIWEVTIPSNDVTTAGLVVSVMAWDSRDVVNSTAWFDVPVYFYSLKFATTSPEEYQMISVPGDLDERSLSAVLEPALGKQDPTKWRIFQWNGSDYSENNGDFGPFQAFWIITREASSLRTKSGQTIPLTKQLRVDLAYGWNMVGLPVNFPVDIDAVTVTKNGGIEPLLYEWDGSSYTTTNTFTPGSGYWIYSNSAGWLGFDFVGAAASQGSGKALVSDDGPGWQANLTAGIGKYRDRLNTFGVHQEALDGKDSRDFHEPPVIGNYISIAFENEGWNPSDGGYSVDIKSPATDVKTWKLTARSNLKGIATITLDDPGQIPPQDGVWLVDQTQGIAYDLRKDQRITFASPGNDKPYSFLLLVGERSALGQQMEQLNLVPDRFELAQNTPNPFNPVTTIGISLTKDAVVTLRVFNVLGQELNVLALNKPMAKGKHRFIWAGKDSHGNQLPSGVYLYRLEIKNNFDQVMFGDTKKMLLVK